MSPLKMAIISFSKLVLNFPIANIITYIRALLPSKIMVVMHIKGDTKQHTEIEVSTS